jgi:hypothetical protein
MRVAKANIGQVFAIPNLSRKALDSRTPKKKRMTLPHPNFAGQFRQRTTRNQRNSQEQPTEKNDRRQRDNLTAGNQQPFISEIDGVTNLFNAFIQAIIKGGRNIAFARKARYPSVRAGQESPHSRFMCEFKTRALFVG